MKKRVGILGLVVTAAGLLFQPAMAVADDFGHATQVRVEQRHDTRVVAQYRVPADHRDVKGHAPRELVVKRDVHRDWR